MTRTPIITAALTLTGMLAATFAGPAGAYAGGCETTIYNNYGNAVYYTTNNDVSYSRTGFYVPANYPASFVYPQAAPSVYAPVYREPVYPRTVYYEPVYVEPAPRRSFYVSAGYSSGYHREVYRSRAIVHHSARVIHSPSAYVHRSPAYGRHYYGSRPVHHYDRPRGAHFSFGHRR